MAMRDLVKWIKLRLDERAAKKSEEDAKKALGGIDGAISKLKGAAKSLGAVLASAFAIDKILGFGRAAVDEALRGEREWSKLGATVRATGQDFAALRPDIDAASQAFQDATVYGAGDYLTALDRMIALTGDVSASINNMGLVADVAAQFFDGELGPAADLVAKAMNGNTAALGKMGIQAESAQEALDILANRSMGAAAARAATLTGQMQSLNEEWNDFLDLVGSAILESEAIGEGFSFLSWILEELTRYVEENKEAIVDWVTNGIRFAIDAADVLYRAIFGMAQLIRGGFNTSLGIGALALSTLAEGYALALTAASKFLSFIGAKDAADGLEGFSLMVKEGAERLREFANNAITAGGQQVQDGIGRLSERAWDSEQFRAGGRNTRQRGQLATSAPQVGANMKPEGLEEETERVETATDRIVAAVERFGDVARTNRTLSELMGEDFDALASEAQNLEQTIASLAAEGLEPNDALLVMLRDRLREVRGEMEAMERATKMEEDAMRSQAAAAAELASALGAAMAGGLGPFAKGKARQNALEAAELTLRAGAAVLSGFGAAKAPAFLGLAAKHSALAVAWGAAGALFGGSGGGSTAMSPGAARGASGSTASAVQPGNDVQIYLTGPGFNALNPEVQKVVRGAYEQSTERQGNARVRIITREG